MDRENLTEIYKMLGELSANVRNLTDAVNKQGSSTTKELERVKARLDRVEKFNIRVLAYASVATPFLLAAIKWLVPEFLSIM